MIVGFLSDTHGNIEDTTRALELLEDADKIIHLGDVLAHGPRNPLTESYNPKTLADVLKERDNIIYVRGNCDADVDQMVLDKDLSNKEIFLDLGDFKLYATHGYEESDMARIFKGRELGADVVAWGHSHIKVLDKDEDMIILNPGSTTLPKDGSKSIGRYENGVFSLIDLESGKTLHEIKKDSDIK